MHLKRQKATTKLPIPRKGTTYIARASSHFKNSVPVLVAVRDMLKLARNRKEVRKMIQDKKLLINNKVVKSPNESIRLFNVLTADKTYTLSLLPTKKFSFEKHSSSERIAKITNKKLIGKNKIQLNLHDGTNILSNEKYKVGDSIHLDKDNKIKKHTPLEKGKSVFIISGKYTGSSGKIEKVEGKSITISIKGEDKEPILKEKQVIVQ